MKPQVTRNAKPRSCEVGYIWHPRLDKCLSLDAYQQFEKFYGSNSKATREAMERRENQNPERVTPTQAIRAEVEKRKP